MVVHIVYCSLPYSIWGGASQSVLRADSCELLKHSRRQLCTSEQLPPNLPPSNSGTWKNHTGGNGGCGSCTHRHDEGHAEMHEEQSGVARNLAPGAKHQQF